MDAANVLFRDTLKVIPVQGNLVLQGSDTPQGLYGGVYLSSAYTEGMPNTDIVVFVTARPILQDGGSSTETLAVARVVQEDQVGRPIFGHLNINPAGIDTSTATYARNFGVVIHEMTHALGFNVNKFKSINAAPGQPVCDYSPDPPSFASFVLPLSLCSISLRPFFRLLPPLSLFKYIF